MDARRKIEALIEKKQAELQDIQDQIDHLQSVVDMGEVYIQGLQDSLKYLPKENASGTGVEAELRSGTELAKARDYIKKVGHPVHITELLRAIGKEVTKPNRSSLAGSLGWYVRRGEIFTRPAPNTFGLLKMDAPSTDVEGDGEDMGVELEISDKV